MRIKAGNSHYLFLGKTEFIVKLYACVENIAPENVESCLLNLKDWPSWGGKITGKKEIKLVEQRIKNTVECATFAAGTAIENGKIIGIIASNAGESSKKALANFS